jgi:2-isopropylmalate synthase
MLWQITSLSYKSGTDIKPQVELTLKMKSQTYKKEMTGDGPVDACYKALEAITGVKGTLLDYSIQSVTRGKDAMGEVMVKVQSDDITVRP